MKEYNTDVQGAIDWTAMLHAEMVKKFNNLYLEIPRRGGPLGLEVQSYVNGMAQWVGANVQWSMRVRDISGNRVIKLKRRGSCVSCRVIRS
jgi:hypothetical protein